LDTTGSITPFDAEVNVQAGGSANGGVTEIPVYDLQEWDVRITLESTESTHALRRGSDDFILKLHDVCWDLPLTAPLLTKNVFTMILWHQDDNNVARDLPNIDPANELKFTTGWVDTYCGGATYVLELVTADMTTAKAIEVDGAGVAIDITAELNAKLLNTHAANGSDLSFTGYFDSTDWVNPSTGEGTWTMRIKATVGTADATNSASLQTRGNSGTFKSIYSANFDIVVVNPCISSQVSDIVFAPLVQDTQTPPIDYLEARVNAGEAAQLRTYADPAISKNTFPSSDGVSFCGNRLHYIADYKTATDTYDNYVLLHPSYAQRNSLYFKSLGTTPDTFEIKLDPTTELDLGLYHYAVIIELEDYPKATWPLVTREEKRFDVKINPCKLTTLEAGSYTSKVEYIVGNPRKGVPFTFTQAPCNYDGTYFMTLQNGGSSPSFVTQLDRFPIYDMYTVDESHVGNYTMRVTIILDNLQAFADLDPGMEDYVTNVNDPSTYQGSGTLLYTSYIDFDMEIKPPESDYQEPDNTPPYLLPPPVDFYVEVGTYKQFYLGEAIDQEAVNQTVVVEVDYTSAKKLINYDDVTRMFTIYESVTEDINIGFYDLTITIYDNFDTVVIDEYIECEDRTDFATDAQADACEDRERGETVYNIKMEVRKKFEVGDVFVPPTVTEIIYEYQGQVFDLGNTTLEDVYGNVAVVGIVDEFNTILSLAI